VAARRWISADLADTLGSVLPDRLQRFEVVDSWEDAERRCIGYEQSTLRDSGPLQVPPRERMDRPTSRDLQLIAALGVCLEAGQSGSRVRVLDFGGAFGHYFDVARFSFSKVPWEWTVVETATMATLAVSKRDDPGAEPRSEVDRTEAERTEAPQSISWTSDLASVLDDRWDFVLASASLNYVPDPMEVLNKLGRLAPYALFTRLPLWPVGRHLPAVQRLSRLDPGGAYPTWVFSEADFLDEIEAFGDVVLRFDIPEDTARIAGHRGTYTGLLVRTRNGLPAVTEGLS
jgi:putative methyltransferase (TIGR04325 family)